MRANSVELGEAEIVGTGVGELTAGSGGEAAGAGELGELTAGTGNEGAGAGELAAGAGGEAAGAATPQEFHPTTMMTASAKADTTTALERANLMVRVTFVPFCQCA